MVLPQPQPENAYHSEFQAVVAKETRISSSQCLAPDSRGQDGRHKVGGGEKDLSSCSPEQ